MFCRWFKQAKSELKPSAKRSNGDDLWAQVRWQIPSKYVAFNGNPLTE